MSPSQATEQVALDDPEGPELQRENSRIKVDKNDKEYDAADLDRPEGDFFDFEEEEVNVDAQEFMAVKPWIGAIREPDNHPPVNKSKPDQTYELEYVYGYRCQDSRQNVYYNPNGDIVYMTAAVGVILHKATNTQTFFGGGEVDNTSK